MRVPSDSLHGPRRSGAAQPRAFAVRAPTDHRDVVRNPSLLGRGPEEARARACPCPTPAKYVMLSPRGGRPHDATEVAPAPSSSSSSPRQAGMDAGASDRVLEWEIGLPAASELTPVSHSLITPALAAAFRINIAGPAASSSFDDSSLAHDSPTSHLSFRCDEDDDEEGEGEGETEDAASRGGRTGKKARMVWTPKLHHRFVEAVAHLGDKGAVPKAIVRLMNVEGLTRENVASHLQKYRIYLKRTRNPASTQPSPSFPAAYGSPFNSQSPSNTSDRSGYCAFPSRDSEKLERDQALQAMGWKRTKDAR